MYITPPYESFRFRARPMQQCWMRRQLNKMNSITDLHPWFINKVECELENLRVKKSNTNGEPK